MVMVANLPVLASKEAKALERPLSFVSIEYRRRKKKKEAYFVQHRA